MIGSFIKFKIVQVILPTVTKELGKQIRIDYGIYRTGHFLNGQYKNTDKSMLMQTNRIKDKLFTVNPQKIFRGVKGTENRIGCK